MLDLDGESEKIITNKKPEFELKKSGNLHKQALAKYKAGDLKAAAKLWSQAAKKHAQWHVPTYFLAKVAAQMDKPKAAKNFIKATLRRDNSPLVLKKIRQDADLKKVLQSGEATKDKKLQKLLGKKTAKGKKSKVTAAASTGGAAGSGSANAYPSPPKTKKYKVPKNVPGWDNPNFGYYKFDCPLEGVIDNYCQYKYYIPPNVGKNPYILAVFPGESGEVDGYLEIYSGFAAKNNMIIVGLNVLDHEDAKRIYKHAQKKFKTNGKVLASGFSYGGETVWRSSMPLRNMVIGIFVNSHSHMDNTVRKQSGEPAGYYGHTPNAHYQGGKKIPITFAVGTKDNRMKDMQCAALLVQNRFKAPVRMKIYKGLGHWIVPTSIPDLQELFDEAKKGKPSKAKKYANKKLAKNCK